MNQATERRVHVANYTWAVRATEKDRVLDGYAALYNTRSEKINNQFYERIQPGAFRKVLASNPDVRFLVNHDPNTVLGRTKSGTLRLNEDRKGLHFNVSLPNTTAGRDLYEQVSRGDMNQCSFGFVADDDSWDHEDDVQLPVRTVRSYSQLLDVSAVAYPAYQETMVSARCLYEARRSSNPDFIETIPLAPAHLREIRKLRGGVDQFLRDLFNDKVDETRARRQDLLNQVL